MFPRTIKILPPRQRTWKPTGINVYKKVFEMGDHNLKEHINNVAEKTYGQAAKLLQIDAVANLVMGRNTFLLAGTGFGKSRIAEIYYKMIPHKQRAVVLVLNPLDSLGDNQVYEKEQAGFTAINLNKLSFNKKAAEDISKGVYQFVYMSPEIFLNNKMWEEVYFSSNFQNRLGLVVVDEAHMIYIWGLVESGPGKHLAAIYGRHEDQGIFRPSYGNLGGHLLSRNDAPILLLSATCRPVAVEAIKKSLRLDDSNVDILRGELTRPEIQIIRTSMDHSMSSCHDLIKIFPSAADVPNHEVVPTLVYSGSRNRTLTALEVIGMARQTDELNNPKSTCVRRYHSCTGDQDKKDCVEDFANGLFPIVSCTMALGLGQNWKRVRMVVHMGRGDPASIVQMVGRCGRDGRPGLAILFVEKTRRTGKNSVEEFKDVSTQSDDDRMDALAVTPVCLRVAFSIDNLLGYIPLQKDDPNVLREIAREEQNRFSACLCSNCDASSANSVLSNLQFSNIHNFDRLITNQLTTLPTTNPISKLPVKKLVFRKRKVPEAELNYLKKFEEELVADFGPFYYTQVLGDTTVLPEYIFGTTEAAAIGAYMHQIHNRNDLRIIIGGELVTGQLDWLMERLDLYKCTIRKDLQAAKNTANLAAKNPSNQQPISKKPRLQGVAPTETNPTTLTTDSTVGTRKMTKKEEAALERRRVSLAKAEKKRVLSEQAEKRKAQIASILNEGRAAMM